MKNPFACLIAISAIGLFFIFSTISFASSTASGSYEIQVQLTPYKDVPVILGHYYGEQIRFDAHATLDSIGRATFSGDSLLHEGIYVVFPEGTNDMVDFLIDSSQHFSVYCEFTEFGPVVRFKNSGINDILSGYKQYMMQQQQSMLKVKMDADTMTNPADSVIFKARLSVIDDSIHVFRKTVIDKHPDSFISMLLLAMQEPELIGRLAAPVDSADSSDAHQYIKTHFWNGVNFWDGRLLYTPFFAQKMDKYFKEILDFKADSVIPKIDWMMSTAIADEGMTHLILDKLFFGCMYHSYKWEDAVFVHVFENYLAEKKYSWLNEEQRGSLTDYAFLLMANTKGTAATEIVLPNPSGERKSLMSTKAKYTLLVFWDATCSHCRETLPVLDSLYRVKWKKKGVRMYAVSVETDGTRAMWSTYIKEHHLEEWTHVYDSADDERALMSQGLKPVLQQYNVWYYPSFFLLDNDKRYLAKKLSYPKIAEFVNSLFD